jgi:methylphosphotriester-DNA--protein-cysteine methyltransferase
MEKKKSNKKNVSELFKKRTGVTYQNWIQAMGVQKKIELNTYEIVVDYATETTTQSYKYMEWSYEI